MSFIGVHLRASRGPETRPGREDSWCRPGCPQRRRAPRAAAARRSCGRVVFPVGSGLLLAGPFSAAMVRVLGWRTVNPVLLRVAVVLSVLVSVSAHDWAIPPTGHA